MYFLLLILGLATFILVFSKLAILYSEKVIIAMVEKKHRDAEAILATCIVPLKWGKGGVHSFVGEEISKFIVIRQLEKLIKYFQHSPLVEGDDAREMLVGRLQGVRDSWYKMNWKDIYPYE